MKSITYTYTLAYSPPVITIAGDSFEKEALCEDKPGQGVVTDGSIFYLFKYSNVKLRCDIESITNKLNALRSFQITKSTEAK